MGAAGEGPVWKLTQHAELTTEISDSSHSGIGAGAKRRRRVGLDGAEAANIGGINELNEAVGIDSQLTLGFEFLVGDERGGVTGALLDIRRGGRAVGMARLRRKGKM